jgi:hypothetical protein
MFGFDLFDESEELVLIVVVVVDDGCVHDELQKVYKEFDLVNFFFKHRGHKHPERGQYPKQKLLVLLGEKLSFQLHEGQPVTPVPRDYGKKIQEYVVVIMGINVQVLRVPISNDESKDIASRHAKAEIFDVEVRFEHGLDLAVAKMPYSIIAIEAEEKEEI